MFIYIKNIFINANILAPREFQIEKKRIQSIGMQIPLCILFNRKSVPILFTMYICIHQIITLYTLNILLF